MDPLLATLVLVLLALAGARVSFSTESVPAGPRLLFRTGIHYALAGVALGPLGLEFLSRAAVEQLYPLLGLGLGWIGFLFGMQLDRSTLRHFPPAYYVLALGQAALAFVLIFVVARVGLGALGHEGDVITVMIAAAAATACITTPAGIAMVSANFLVRGNVGQLLFFIASVDALVGILALQVTYAVYHPAAVVIDLGNVPALGWMTVAVGLGVILGILFLWLTRPRPGREELVLFLLGTAALSGGAALQLQLSPLFVCTVMGAVVANLAQDRQRIFQALEKWEKPIYVTFLMLAGALLTFETFWVLPLALAYAVLRGVAKVGASAALVPLVRLPFAAPRRLGLGLIPQGGISLVMAVSLMLTYSGLRLPDGTSGAETLFAVILVGVILSELTGPFLTHHVLRRAGEISPRVEEALAEGDRRGALEAAIRDTTPAQAGGDEGAPPESTPS
ncbi:MAG: cation:proton antiporter [Gemmatimonadetes bacterium]|nr:cation:proton antiporter [Gemmatimonadota bacterium]